MRLLTVIVELQWWLLHRVCFLLIVHSFHNQTLKLQSFICCFICFFFLVGHNARTQFMSTFFLLLLLMFFSSLGNLNAATDSDILDSNVFPNVYLQFVFGTCMRPWKKKKGKKTQAHKETVWCRKAWLARSRRLVPTQSYALDELGELERQLQARPYHPTSVPGPNNDLVAEWEKITAARVQNLWGGKSPAVDFGKRLRLYMAHSGLWADENRRFRNEKRSPVFSFFFYQFLMLQGSF